MEIDNFVMTAKHYVNLFKQVERNTGKPLNINETVNVTWQEPGGAMIVMPSDSVLLILSRQNAALITDLWPEIERQWEEHRASGD